MKKPTADKAAILYGPLGEITKALDPYTEADPIGVHMSLIAAFSAYLGRDIQLESSDGLSPLSIWPVLIGYTGKGCKGKATRMAMNVVNAAFAAFSSEVIPELPVTGLGLFQALEERSNDDRTGKPVLAIHSELDSLVSNAKKDIRLGSALRRAWDGEDIRFKSGTNDIIVNGVHLAIIGHVQPGNWSAVLGSKDARGGTYNRFLPVYVEQSKRIRKFGHSSPTEVFKDMGRKLRKIAQAAKEVRLVTVTSEVGDVFEAHHRLACEALTDGNEVLGQMSDRAMSYMERLAALYALADGRDQISVEDFDSALAIVRYSVESVTAVLPEAGGDRLTSKIEKALRFYGQMSKSELWDEIGRNYKAPEIDRALLALAHNVRRTKGESTGGRPPVIYEWIEEDSDELEAVPA